MTTHRARSQVIGFTLIEVMVALVILALLAAMAWQGLASMFNTRERVRDRAQALLGLQTGMAQWQADLRAHSPDLVTLGLVFDGQALRFTRRDAVDNSKLRVVAWAIQRQVLRRWESPALTEADAIRTAWRSAHMWAQSGTDTSPQATVHAISPATSWTLAYFYADGWTNAQSSAQNTNDNKSTAPPASNPEATTSSNTACDPGLRCVGRNVPEQPLALRLTLTLPASAEQPWSGPLVMQWLRTGASLSK